MKKLCNNIFLILSCLLIATSSQSQIRGTDTCGVWYQTNVYNGGISNIFGTHKQNFIGATLISEWADIRDGLNSPYKFHDYDSVIKQHADTGYFMILQLNTGQGTPDSILNIVGKYSTTGHSDTGPYPYYYNPVYQAYVFQMMNDYLSHLSSLPTNTKNKILAIFFGFGSTGDLGPNKGTPVGYSYDNDGDGDLETTINDADPEWIAWRHKFWDSAQAKINRYLPGKKLAANPGNNEEEYSYLRLRYPGVFGKSGDDSHGKSYRGEKNSKAKDETWALKTGIYAKYYAKAEMQAGDVLKPVKAHKETFSQFVFMANMRLTFPCWTGAMFNVLEAGETVSPRLYVDWFNSHVGAKNEIKKGFSYPHNIPDYADLDKFPPNLFGELIDPLKADDHAKQIKNILERPDSIEQKNVSIIKKIEDNLNPLRKTLIQAQYSQLKFNVDTPYYNDGIVDGLQNYELGLQLQNANEGTDILARIGPDTSFHGRWAYKLKIIDGMGVAKYNVDEKLKKTKRGDTLFIKINYYDTSNYTWIVRIPFCKNSTVLSVTNTNTHQWKEATCVVPNFNFRPNGHDFQIKSQYAIIWELVEVENLSKH